MRANSGFCAIRSTFLKKVDLSYSDFLKKWTRKGNILDRFVNNFIKESGKGKQTNRLIPQATRKLDDIVLVSIPFILCTAHVVLKIFVCGK